MFKSIKAIISWLASVAVLVVALCIIFPSCNKDNVGSTGKTDNSSVKIEETAKPSSTEIELTAEEKLNEILDEDAAYTAAIEYGKKNYSNFKVSLVNMADGFEQYAKDDCTWRIKTKCQVDGVECWMFADVTGNTNNPEVSYFEVHE